MEPAKDLKRGLRLLLIIAFTDRQFEPEACLALSREGFARARARGARPAPVCRTHPENRPSCVLLDWKLFRLGLCSTRVLAWCVLHKGLWSTDAELCDR